ncbi:alpha/beta hydrolase [Brachyspira hyodysenteriae]|uniref:alpha/beta fold hydrolase n=1 Tax=Brachyspira hyodysenteriae TaxID=159 RepID=UPI00063DB7AB|nr:alpha/beta hydrolase [Brachyspira hyodysenteriae]KLI35793.1 alpha/beta hydrolase [Brachyspira hyodysenteriae]
MDIFFEEYININGIEQYFVHYPKKSNTTLLFLHGGPGESEAYFLYKMHSKTQNYNLVYYDQRGTGKTQLKNKSNDIDITIEKLLIDLKETINYVKLRYNSKYIILLGHSWGSVLGIEFIKKFPNLVSAYIGMGQVVNFKIGEKTGFDYCYDIVQKSNNQKYIKKIEKLKNYPFIINKNNVFEIFKNFREIQVKYKLAGYYEGNDKLNKIIKQSPIYSFKDMFNSNPLMLNKNIIYYLINYDTSKFTNFSIPIFFICGANDWQVPTVIVKEYYKTINAPDKDIFIAENAGHLLNIENTKDYNLIVEGICSRVSGL